MLTITKSDFEHIIDALELDINNKRSLAVFYESKGKSKTAIGLREQADAIAVTKTKFKQGYINAEGAEQSHALVEKQS